MLPVRAAPACIESTWARNRCCAGSLRFFGCFKNRPGRAPRSQNDDVAARAAHSFSNVARSGSSGDIPRVRLSGL